MKLFAKLLSFFRPKYNIVYTKQNGKTHLYTISKPKRINEFHNQREGSSNVGVRAWCYNRNGVRSFRYDRITSLYRA